MRFGVKLAYLNGRHESAVETYAANRRAPITLAMSGTPEGMLVMLYIKPLATLITLGIAMVMIYLGASLGAAWWFSRVPHNRIHVADVMLPWRWSTLRDLRGQMHLAQGVEALEKKQYAHGIFLIRRGLANHPNDAGARLALAEIQAKVRDYEGVRQTVLPQLAFPPVPRALLQVLTTEAGRADDPATIAECGERLATTPASAADHQWLQLRRANALLSLKRPDAALMVLADPAFQLSGDAAELRVNALCALGRVDEAIALAAALPRAHPGEPQRRLRLLARAQREAGRKTELAATVGELIALAPADVESRLFAIEQLWLGNLRDEARRELDALLGLVSARPGALAGIVQRISDDGAPELIKRCVDEARALGQPVDAMLSVLAIACIRSADWTQAAEAVAAKFGGKRPPSERELQGQALLRAAIDAGAQGTARAYGELKNLLAGEPLVVTTYVRLAEGLARAERWEAVQIVTDAGLRTYRRSATLLRLASEAREKIAALAKAAPAASVMPAVARGPDLSKFDAASFTTRVNELLQQQRWDAAAELIAAVRRVEPPWFSTVAPELDWQDARIAFGRDDRLRAVKMIGFALKWPHRDVERALGFAREYRAAGNHEAALAVTRKILEIVPDSAAAQHYQAELEKEAPGR